MVDDFALHVADITHDGLYVACNKLVPLADTGLAIESFTFQSIGHFLTDLGY